ncbi:hypothetical protein [Williamsia maris]|uniref:DUF4878 domain-containing protein n=1 Tax=Williamsia maris TaxID=72806 RepID=A0ABT1HJE6_9NOCA|nr:hypothetical protein [Williamsia maris]MCP2178053.1 hypothetical protein [Williamsia maris]
MSLRNKQIPATWVTAGALLAVLALVIAACGWAGVFGASSEVASRDKSTKGVEQAVTGFLTSYRDRDWTAASDRSCGDIRIQLLDKEHSGLISTPTTQRAAIVSANDFHYTQIDGPVATTYARVTIGVPGDPEGNTPAIAFFALAQTDNTWKVCTAANAATGALQ